MSLRENQRTFLVLLLGLVLGRALIFAAANGQGDGNANNGTSGGDAITYASMLFVILLLFAFASLPILWNIKGYYGHLSQIRDLLDKRLSSSCNQAELVQLVKDALAVQSSGMQGVARATMALTLSVILGAAIFLLIANPCNLNADNAALTMLKDILLALTGAISSIIGFYFGGRATQNPVDGGSQPTPAPANNMPVIKEFKTDPESPAKPETPVKLSCSATNPSGGSLQYKFEVLDKDGKRIDGTPGYQNQSEWTWNTKGLTDGKYILCVYVRDGLHADITGFDSRQTKEFEIKT